jgi:hypothetical protein
MYGYQIVAEDLNMREACAKVVSKSLYDDQKVGRKELSTEMLEQLKIEPEFLIRLITGDES